MSAKCYDWTIESTENPNVFKVWSNRLLVAIVRADETEVRVVWGRMNDIGLGLVARQIRRMRVAA
jgi:hypothetical protein